MTNKGIYIPLSIYNYGKHALRYERAQAAQYEKINAYADRSAQWKADLVADAEGWLQIVECKPLKLPPPVQTGTGEKM